jgi:hypothetical protein
LKTNLYIGRLEVARKIANLMQEYNSVFIPHKIDIEKVKDRPHKILVEENMERFISEMSSGEYPGIVGERKRPVRASYIMNATKSQMFDYISITIEEEWFTKNDNLRKFIDFAKEMYKILEASSGYIQYNTLEERYDRIETIEENGSICNAPRFPGSKYHLSGLYWANIFGPEYIEMWGHEFLLESPCKKIEELHDGGMIMYLAESPLDAKESWYGNIKEQLFNYLGYEAFNGKRYPKFRTKGKWRKKRTARPLIETNGILDDVFAE